VRGKNERQQQVLMPLTAPFYKSASTSTKTQKNCIEQKQQWKNEFVVRTLLLSKADDENDNTSVDGTNNNLERKGTRQQQQQQERKTITFLAKTRESFKLSELYVLDANVRAQYDDTRYHDATATQDNDDDDESLLSLVKQVEMQRSTGSILLSYTTTITTKTSPSPLMLPFVKRRYQYIAKQLSFGSNVSSFLNNSCLLFSSSPSIGEGGGWSNIGVEKQDANQQILWTLGYECFSPLHIPKECNENSNGKKKKQQQEKGFSSQTLLHHISRILPPEPILNPNTRDKNILIVHFVLIETSHGLYLVQKLLNEEEKMEEEKEKQRLAFSKKWSGRPFQYSSAVNMNVADVIMDLMSYIVSQQKRKNGLMLSREEQDLDSVLSKQERQGTTQVLLDPTCGSGTFLSFGVHLGMNVVGIDINDKCVEGTQKNLKYMFGDDVIVEGETSSSSAAAHVFSGDSSRLLLQQQQQQEEGKGINGKNKYSCVVSNIPWNQNTFDFASAMTKTTTLTETTTEEESNALLMTLRQILDNDVPCVFVTKTKDEIYDILISLGFRILGVAHVPPVGFELPLSKKKKNKKNASDKMEMTKEDDLISSSAAKVGRSSDCVITVAIAPGICDADIP